MNPPELQPAETMTDLERRFGGIARLYGVAALGNFRRAHVCVIGIGGVGSWAVEALARSAIGQITLIDLDHVAESNINRQLHALDATLGRAKVAVMAERVRQINPACRVNTIEDHLGLDNLGELLDRNYDYVIDCVDGFRIKAALIAWCRRNKVRLVTVGGAGGQTNPAQIMTADLSNTEHDALFSKTRRLLRQEYGFPKNLKRRFDIPCIYSREQPVFPAADGSVCHDKPDTTEIGGLNCAGGLGSVMTVTASFGLQAVAHVLGKLRMDASHQHTNSASLLPKGEGQDEGI
jgi:tRNA A37 threonylcarbamoyladenosine dehydratase